MNSGDVVKMNHISLNSGKLCLYYSAGKKDQFVLILLGVEPKDGSKQLDPVKRLEELGWIKKDE